MRQTQLHQIINNFHTAMIGIAQDSDLFRDYPRGCCGNGSEMLCYYLFKEHNIETTIVTGEIWKPEYGSHAWLEYGELIIDLTCCQFDKCRLECPYVGTDREWHDRWGEDSRLDFRDVTQEWVQHSTDEYRELLSQINAR